MSWTVKDLIIKGVVNFKNKIIDIKENGVMSIDGKNIATFQDSSVKPGMLLKTADNSCIQANIPSPDTILMLSEQAEYVIDFSVASIFHIYFKDGENTLTIANPTEAIVGASGFFIIHQNSDNSGDTIVFDNNYSIVNSFEVDQSENGKNIFRFNILSDDIILVENLI